MRSGTQITPEVGIRKGLRKTLVSVVLVCVMNSRRRMMMGKFDDTRPAVPAPRPGHIKKTFKVDGWNNFCRVFEFPENFSNEFCFGGGIDTTFKMVDWFNPIGELPQPACSKEVWEEKVGEIEVLEFTYEELRDRVGLFVETKRYIQNDKTYVILFDFGAAIVINPKEYSPAEWT